MKASSPGRSKRDQESVDTIRSLVWDFSLWRWEWWIERMPIHRTPDGSYVLENKPGLWGLPKTVVGRTAGEARLKTLRKMCYHESRRALQALYERQVLLGGLRVHSDLNGWYLGERDFERFLNRVRRRGLAIYGIESWRRKRRRGQIRLEFQDCQIHEDYPQDASNPKWYFAAFRKMRGRGSGLMFGRASVDIPDALVSKWVISHRLPPLPGTRDPRFDKPALRKGTTGRK